MRTRMKLLTVGLVLVTAAVAGCSSTAGSSGAVQDDASSAASSPAASTGPAPSPDLVSPSPGPTGATASPVASPTDSPSPSVSPTDPAQLGEPQPELGDAGSNTQPNNNVCDTGMAYSCGDIGASGVGTVFYARSTAFPCGADGTSLCNYLEVAPNGWNGTLVDCQGGCGGSPNKTSDFGSAGPGNGEGYAWCSGPGQNTLIPNASGTVIGTGYANTSAMLTMCDSTNAGELASGYNGGGMTDWSLPSEEELNALYYYTGRDAIGGFAATYYWSSSQGSANGAAKVSFDNGEWVVPGSGGAGSSSKTLGLGVRPTRAF